MAITFPSPVADGYSFTAENGVVYTFDSSGGGGWYAYHPDGLNDVYVNISGDTMTGDLTVPSLNGGPLGGMRNQIINGNLSVNQRNAVNTTLSIPSSKFVTDRWQFQSSDGQPISCAIRPGNFAGGASAYLDIAGTAQTVFIKQLVELPGVGSQGAFQSNSSWTVSWWGANVEFAGCHFSTGTSGTNGANWTASAPFQVETSGVAVRQGVNLTVSENIGASDTCVEVVWKVTTPNTAASFYSAQLEPGPVATPFEMRPIGTELALCQRYYQTVEQGVIQVEAHSTSGRDFVFAEQTVAMRPKTTLLNGPTNIILTNDIANTANVKQYTCEAPDIQGDGIIRVKTNFAPSGQNGTPDATAVWKTEQPFNADAEL